MKRGHWVAVLALAGLAAAQSAAAQQLGPLCAGLAGDLGLDPALVGNFVSSLPEPPATGFCTWLTSNLTREDACDLLTLLDYGLTDGGSGAPPRCDNPSVGPPDVEAPSGVLAPLQDRRPLPPAFDDDTAEELFGAEGATYYQLFRFSRNAYAFAGCANSDPGAALPLPPGWALLANASVEQDVGPPLPQMWALRNEASNQLLLVVRATVGASEWGANFQYNLTADATQGGIFGGNLSSGFLGVFQQIWPTAREVLADLATNATAGSTPEVYVTGHSMGAGVGGLVAYAAAQYLQEEMGEEAPRVDAVFFSAPQVSDGTFVEEYNALVNARTVDFSADLITEVPCDPVMPACSGTPSALLAAVGVSGTDTTDGGTVQDWPYRTVGGRLQFTPDQLPLDTETWETIKAMPLCWASIYLQAAHVCSYSCYLSSFDPDQANQGQYCWLSRQPPGAPGTQCPIFPNGWLTPDAAAAPGPAAEAQSGAAAVPAPIPSPVASSGRALFPSGVAMLVAMLEAALLWQLQR